MKTLSSPILFKQIIGRGTRIDPATGKLWFRIIDYTNATRLLDPKWDKPPSPHVDIPPTKEQNCSIAGKVQLDETGELITGARVAVVVAPNDQRGPILTNENGRYKFDGLPEKKVTVIAYGIRLNRKQTSIALERNRIAEVNFELSRASDKSGTIKVEGLEVNIAEEATFIVEGLDEPLTLEQYIDYTREKLLSMIPGWKQLVEIWQRDDAREKFTQKLTDASVHPEILAESLEKPDADPFDVLAHIAFRKDIKTRKERVESFRKREREWLEKYSPKEREVIIALLGKYEIGGLGEITDPNIFRVNPFRRMGELRGVIKRFDGDPDYLKETINQIQMRLYK